MKMTKHLIRTLAVAIAAAVASTLSSCDSDGCTQNQSSIPLAEFYDYTTLKSISLDSLQIRGLDAPGDSILRKSSSMPFSSIYLPMRPEHNSVTWVFDYMWREARALDLSDRITIQYASEPYFASEECGAFYQYRITSLEHTDALIDSVAVTDSLVTNIDKAYLKLYFRTQDDENL